jgi:hypothetical protein
MIDVRAHVREIPDVTGEHTIERRATAKVRIGTPHPLVGKGRIAEDRMESAEYPEQVRDAFELIAGEVWGTLIVLPSADRSRTRGEKRRALISA